MKFVTTSTWDAPLPRVMAMLSDVRYAERKLELMNFEFHEVLSSKLEGDIFTVVTHIIGKPSIKLPALAQKFIKPDQSIEIEQTDTWDRATATGSLKLINKSISVVTISAQMALTEANGQTVNTLSWTVACSLPLIGGKLAEMLAEDVRAKAGDVERISQQILSESF